MGPIQSSINTALGVAALASGLTNKKQVDKAQDKLDKKEGELAKKESQLTNTKKDLTNTKKDLAEIKAEKSALEDEKNMQYGLNTFNVSNDLPTAKETNITNTAGNNSVNDIKGPSPSEFIKTVENEQKKVDPYTVEQIMGFRGLKMSDSMIAAKKAVGERIRSRRAMIKARAINGGNE